MYFNVYFDPQVISVANAAGELGLQTLTAILRGFLQNCFLAEFKDYRIQPEISSYMAELPETSDRSTLKKIFKKLDSDNRFIYCLPAESDANSLSALTIAANREMIDVILLAVENDDLAKLSDIETETLSTYQNSNFEGARSELAGDGVALEPLSMESQDFLDRYLKRALQHAQRIDIIDKLLLLKYQSNFRYTLKHFFKWLESTLREPSNCRIVFHSAYNDDQDALNELRTDLTVV